MNSWYLCFIAGVVLADIYSSKYINIKKIGNIQRLFIITVIVYLAGFPLSENTNGDWYRIFQGLNLRNLALSVAAILSVYLTLFDDKIKRIFEYKRISGLGKYTFSIYLIHLPVIYTFTCALFNYLVHHGMSYNISSAISIVATIPVILGGTYLFERYVDSKSIAISSRIANLIVK